MLWIVLAHAAATLFMTGLIWFVQVVHYPLFAAVGGAQFAAYSRAHQSLTTLVVAPTMLVEAFTAVALVAFRPPGLPGWIVWTGLALLAVIWLSTFALQVPAHGRLAAGFDPEIGDALVSSNWIRTAAWSGRAALVLLGLWHLLIAARPAN